MMSENNNEQNVVTEQNVVIEQNGEPNLPSFQLSPEELLIQMRLKEENKNPYICVINKKLKALNKKLNKLQKWEQLKKSGKELDQNQLESLETLKSHQKKVSHFEELKKNFMQIWENQKQNDPSKLLFSLIHAISVESKAPIEKYAAQYTRLSRFREMLFKEATGFLDYQSSVDNSVSLLQKFVENSDSIAFDEVTFKQLRVDLQETSVGINGKFYFEQQKIKKQEKIRIKEQQENEKKQLEQEQKNLEQKKR